MYRCINSAPAMFARINRISGLFHTLSVHYTIWNRIERLERNVVGSIVGITDVARFLFRLPLQTPLQTTLQQLILLFLQQVQHSESQISAEQIVITESTIAAMPMPFW